VIEMSVHAVQGALILLFFWFFFDVALRYARVESFRLRLGSVRDEMFDFVAGSSSISFDHSAYVLRRRLTNSLVRNADQLRFVYVIATLCSMRHPQHEASLAQRLERSLDKLPPDVEARFRKFDTEITTLVGLKIATVPVLALSTAVLIVWWSFAGRLTQKFIEIDRRKYTKRMTDRIEPLIEDAEEHEYAIARV